MIKKTAKQTVVSSEKHAATKKVEMVSGFSDNCEDFTSDSGEWKKEVEGKKFSLISPEGHPFLPLQDESLKDRNFHFYLWWEKIDFRADVGYYLVLKFGEAIKESVYDRYKGYTGSESPLQKTIALWTYDDIKEGDRGLDRKLVHDKIRSSFDCNGNWLPAREFDQSIKSKEMYVVFNGKGLHELIGHIDKLLNTVAVKYKKIRSDYNDVVKCVDKMLNSSKAGIKNVCADLCVRFGKTGTFLRLTNLTDERITVIVSYVWTALASYKKECEEYKNYENILVIDPNEKGFDEKEKVKEANAHLAKSEYNRVVYLLAITGSGRDDYEFNESLFKRRCHPLKKLLKKHKANIVVEEADFGADCIKQISKINKLRSDENVNMTIVATGTDAKGAAKAIFKNERMTYIVATYLLTVAKREGAVNDIRWYTYDNTSFYKVMEENGRSYDKSYIENFERFFEGIKNGNSGAKSWLSELIKCIFNPNRIVFETGGKVNPEFLLVPDAATIIFTQNNKEYMKILAKLIKSVLDPTGHEGYKVVVLNGDTTTGADAEKDACAAVEEMKGRYDKLIFIAGNICSRSWSVKEVKNVIFFCNASSNDVVSQKVGRGLTPCENHNRCTVLDFRLTRFSDAQRERYIEYNALAVANGYESIDDLKEFARQTEKNISFNTVCFNSEGGSPLHEDKDAFLQHAEKVRSVRVAQFVHNTHKMIEAVRAVCTEDFVNSWYEKTDKNSILSENDFLCEYNVKNNCGVSGKKRTQRKGKNETNADTATESESADETQEHVDTCEKCAIHHAAWLMKNASRFNTGLFKDGNIFLREWETMSENLKRGICCDDATIEFNVLEAVVDVIKEKELVLIA